MYMALTSLIDTLILIFKFILHILSSAYSSYIYPFLNRMRKIKKDLSFWQEKGFQKLTMIIDGSDIHLAESKRFTGLVLSGTVTGLIQ